MSTLLSQDQLRYVVEWFREWSEMQRQDFLEILAEKCVKLEATVNGGLATRLDSLKCKDTATTASPSVTPLSPLESDTATTTTTSSNSSRPPSLFQCRVNLFNEWSLNWSQEEKNSLVGLIKNIDPKFGEQYELRISVLSLDA